MIFYSCCPVKNEPTPRGYLTGFIMTKKCSILIPRNTGSLVICSRLFCHFLGCGSFQNFLNGRLIFVSNFQYHRKLTNLEFSCCVVLFNANHLNNVIIADLPEEIKN